MPDPEVTRFTTVFRADESHRVKRNRKPVSCVVCQKRKAKCDRVKPICGACQQRDNPGLCCYGKASETAAKPDVQQLTLDKLNRLEKLVMQLAPSSRASIGQDDDVAAPKSTDAPPLMGITDEVDAAYHGETSWEAVFKSIEEIRSGVLDVEDDNEEAGEPENMPPPDIVLGDLAPVSLSDIMSSMPSRPTADGLVRTYFGAKFLAVPFIHEHHFRRRYELFWKKPEQANPLWMSIMFSILSLGTMITNAKARNPQDEPPTTTPAVQDAKSDPKFYMLRSAQCLSTGNYLRAKPYSVEALMMFAHSRNIQKEDSDATTWSLYALAVRLAQRRGYHLDAGRVSPSIKPFEAEMRRRTWFMIQSSDLLFSFQLGMPSMIHQDVCDADHPRILTDDDFDEDTLVPESRPSTTPTPLVGWHIKSHLCRLLRRVLQHALAVQPRPYAETMGLQAELDAFYDGVPECFRIRSIADTDPADEGSVIMHRLILELTYRKTLCILHRPYLSVGKHDEQYKVSREICRGAALRILDLHLEIDQETRVGGRMYTDRFMISSLTLHGFLMAAMILCLDLSESTDISLPGRQHHIQVLQRAHSIWSARAAKSKDAERASKVLRAILDRVETPAATTVSDTARLMADEAPSTGYTYGDPSSADAVSYSYSSSVQAPEYALSYDQLMPLDSWFGSAEGLDWEFVY
ncbi:hypothetical protein ACJ41O_005101 [Fusarium nematophilum]